MQHWLPYDETRLYSLLGVTRGDIWRWLRDDTRNLAGLAALHGWKAHDLARELVEPWRGQDARAGADGAARVARAAHADAGPPLAAHVLPLAAPGRDPGRGAGDLRHVARRASATCGAPSSRR